MGGNFGKSRQLRVGFGRVVKLGSALIKGAVGYRIECLQGKTNQISYWKQPAKSVFQGTFH